MPLDPQVAAFLERLATANLTPIHQLTPTEARATVTSGPFPKQNIDRSEDHIVPGLNGPVPVRVYYPLSKHAAGPSANGTGEPGLVFYHGGGWVVCDLEIYDGLCRALANATGCVVISVDYRLAPENKFPKGLEDCYSATEWAFAEAESLGIDPTRIAVGGDSAGANLAAAVCLMAKDRDSFQPAYQLLIYPVVSSDFESKSYKENSTGYFLTRDTMMWFWELYLENPADAQNPYVAPILAENLTGLPDAYVITAEYDPLCTEGKQYADKLQKAGVSVKFHQCDGMHHGFLRHSDIFDRAGEMITDIGSILREVLN
jgi:acetyl esterase